MSYILNALGGVADFFRSEPEIFWGYTAILTLVTFITYARDKYKAKKNLWRTPEGTLLLLAFIGGAVGAFLGMTLCRHKIRKAKFYLCVPFLAVMQIAFIVFMYRTELLSILL